MNYENGSRTYINREISWLDFNFRVLEEAEDKTIPIMERLKFLAITASNLDEFFMVRMSGLLDQIAVGYDKEDPAGIKPKGQIKKLSEVCHRMVEAQYRCLNESLVPEMKNLGIQFLKVENMSEDQTLYVEDYFNEVVFPVVTPMAVDNSRPFPLLSNKSLNLAVWVDVDGEKKIAVLQVPGVIDRYLKLPGDTLDFILLEDVIRAHIQRFFKGNPVMGVHAFRLTRNGDLAIDEDEAEDLLIEIERSIRKRKWGAPVRLEYESGMDDELLRFFRDKLDLHKNDIYEIRGPLDPTLWMKFSFDELMEPWRQKARLPQPAEDFIGFEDNVFEAIRKKDALVHHPYESFDPVVNFVNQAARDDKVLAIKQTLYRVSAASPIIEALIRAAENGKQVTVLVELKARFDEENNIIWAKRLERAGCHVIYGLVGLKIHCKTILVVRKEDDGIKRYVHLGTGNYNDSTAKLYTDIGYFTCRDSFGADVSALFNLLTGYANEPKWKKIAVAPGNMRTFFIRAIDGEIKSAQRGEKAQIIAKMNSLVDEGIINKLYEASQNGVEVILIVRGICCLRSGVSGLSENITVISIVGTFLEHSRVFYFHDGGAKRYYLSSADWMPRNLNRRVETLFPIVDKDLKEKLDSIFDIMLSDNVKMRIQNPDGSYRRLRPEKEQEEKSSQIIFHEQAKKQAERKKKEFLLAQQRVQQSLDLG